MHISFGVIEDTNPNAWLGSVGYFTKILSAWSNVDEVFSVHYAKIDHDVAVNLEGVSYQFIKESFLERLTAWSLIRILRSVKPNTLVIHGFHSAWRTFVTIAQLGNIPVFCQHHGERVFAWPKKYLHKINDRNITGYFFSSSKLGAVWVSRGMMKQEKIFEVMEATSSFPAQVNLRNESLDLVFLWVGRLDTNKDPATLIEAFKQFSASRSDVHLNIICKHSDQTLWIRNKIQDCTQIHFIGEMPHVEMSMYYEKSDFIVSTSHFEGSGVSVLEAMSCGCIPVLSKIPSFEVMTRNGEFGILFPPGSAKDLKVALENASRLDVKTEKARVLQHFNSELSAAAIATKLRYIIAQAVQID